MMLQNKINYSIDLLKKTESLALNMSKDGFYLAFSGGKDSLVLYHLAKMSGVKFTAHHSLTTLDPPELVHFIKREYPDVVIHRPKMTFLQLIKHKKMLPLRHIRYCCSYLKEQSGVGTCTLIGIRASESIRRSKRFAIEKITKKQTDKNFTDKFDKAKELNFECVGGKDKFVVAPILNWTTKDVWDFIHVNKIKYCSLYDDGWHRIGCLFCPMASKKEKQKEVIRYPKQVKAIKRSIQHLIDNGKYMNNYDATADEIFDWWISNESPKKYFGMLRNQMKINFNETEILVK